MNVYEIVTQKVLDKIDQGTIPWRKPWGTYGRQRNYVTRRPYSGMNQFLLNTTEYQSPFWLTYHQAKKLGGVIKKDQLGKSEIAVFWKILESRHKNVRTGADEVNTIPLLRFYKIFNTEQTTLNVELKEATLLQHTPIERCEQIIDGYEDAPPIRYKGERACYIPSLDMIHMPKMELFGKVEEYYSTLFHELGHSTGHEQRLNRGGLNGSFGSDPYAKEELIAEMTAAFLCGHAYIDVLDNSAAYIDGWRKRLSEDKNLVIQAAAQAQKAANYILGKQLEDEKEEEE